MTSPTVGPPSPPSARWASRGIHKRSPFVCSVPAFALEDCHDFLGGMCCMRAPRQPWLLMLLSC